MLAAPTAAAAPSTVQPSPWLGGTADRATTSVATARPASAERCDSHAPAPGDLGLGADLEALVDRPRRQLAAEEEQHGHERGAPVGAASGGGNGGDIRRAGEEERSAEAAAAEEERGDEQHRPERRAPGTNASTGDGARASASTTAPP